jgi:dihydrofolate synthase/folylpolyglutamate synthase
LTVNYSEAVAYLESLTDFERLGFRRQGAFTVNLDSMRALLGHLGQPQQGLACVHIAGTKGKGSVAAMVESTLRAAGLRTGLFTSPHLVSFRERLRVDGRPVSEDEITGLVTAVQPVIEQMRAEGLVNPATFFEVYTAMAYLHFRQVPVDLAVLEAGLGGRLDSTNTCQPVVSAITTLGLDHTEILGDSLEQIAAEKAGIFKPGVPAITSPQPAAALAVLEQVAAEVGAPLQLAPAVLTAIPDPPVAIPPAGAQWKVAGQQVEIATETGAQRYDLSLTGPHQALNAATASGIVNTLRGLGYDLPPAAVHRGLAQVNWPGRLQVVAARPWVVLDAAHNPPAAEALAAAWPGLLEYDRLIAVLGLSAEKDARAFCQALAPLTDHAVLTQASLSRALPVDELAAASRDLWQSFECCDQLNEALSQAFRQAGPRDCVLITGSFYIAGEAIQALGVEVEGTGSAG